LITAIIRLHTTTTALAVQIAGWFSAKP
jgi:hypothetical protein